MRGIIEARQERAEDEAANRPHIIEPRRRPMRNQTDAAIAEVSAWERVEYRRAVHPHVPAGLKRKPVVVTSTSNDLFGPPPL